NEVLDLEVAVSGALEPRPRLEAKALTLDRSPAVIREDPEPRGRLSLDPVAAELCRELEAAAELGLRGREVVAPEYRSDAKVTLGEERPVVDLLRSEDRGAEIFDRLLELTLEVAHERGEDGRHPDLKVSVVGQAGQPLGLE